MKILILKGSPRKNGSSNLLAEHFTRGAVEAGHEVNAIDVAYLDIHPCIGCKKCEFNGLPCVQKDDMEGIIREILRSDMLVFATPLYYFGMSAQLKTCIDRCCASNRQITSKHMKAALLVSAWNSDDWTMTALESHYLTLCRYLELDNRGMVLGIGCGTPSMTEESCFPQMAYELGKNA